MSPRDFNNLLEDNLRLQSALGASLARELKLVEALKEECYCDSHEATFSICDPCTALKKIFPDAPPCPEPEAQPNLNDNPESEEEAY